VPVMLSLVYFANRTQKWFPKAASAPFVDSRPVSGNTKGENHV